MASPATWATRLRYTLSKMSHSAAVSLRRYDVGKIRIGELADCFWNDFSQGNITSVHWIHKPGIAMAPTIHSDGAALLIRKLLPSSKPKRVFIGDVVVIRDPKDTQRACLRRLAAVEGDEIISTDEKDKPFVLAHNQCWVLADNQPSIDSRSFGPISLTYICGRVLYSLRTSVDHAPVVNSCRAMEQDLPILAMELNLEALVHRANMYNGLKNDG